MTPLRPIARNELTGSGAAAVATRKVLSGGGAALARTAVVHSYAALAFYTGGGARVDVGGEWTVREGDVLLVPAGQAHRMLELWHAEFWGLSLCVPCVLANGAAAWSPSLLRPFERVRDGGSAVVHIASARHGYLAGLLGELERVGREMQGRSDAFDAVQKSLLTLILAEVENAKAISDAPRGAGGGVVVDALRFIERNCLGQLTLNDVAAAVGRSPAHVTTSLARATGRSAVQWIVSGRMAEARRLLLHSDERVDRVAERVGYADATHFIRMFRREHGATPAAWRAEHTRGGRGG